MTHARVWCSLWSSICLAHDDIGLDLNLRWPQCGSDNKTAIITPPVDRSCYYDTVHLIWNWSEPLFRNKVGAAFNDRLSQCKQNNFQKLCHRNNPWHVGLSKAAAAYQTALDSEPAGSFFRVAVLGGGCSGFQYDFSIDKNRQDDDLVFVDRDVGGFVVDEMSLELIDHAELDYVQDDGLIFCRSKPQCYSVLRLWHIVLDLTRIRIASWNVNSIEGSVGIVTSWLAATIAIFVNSRN